MADFYEDDISGISVVLPVLTPNTPYVPAFSSGFGTVSNIGVNVRQMGDKAHISGRFQVGTVAGVVATMSMPNGWLAGVGAFTGANYIVGTWASNNVAPNSPKRGVVFAIPGDNLLYFSMDEYIDTKNAFVAQTGTAILGSSNTLGFDGELVIPIQGMSAFQAYGAGVSKTLPSLVPTGYEEYDHVSNFSGPFAATSRTLKVIRVGRQTTIVFPDTYLAGNNTAAAISMVTVLPARFRPTTQIRLPCSIVDTGADIPTPGVLIVDTAGNIFIYKNSASPSFTATVSTCGFVGTSISFVTP